MLVVILSVSALVLSLALCAYRRKGSHKSPPGPSGWPLCGNMFQIDTQRIHHDLKDISDKYGPICRLNLLGTNVVVVTSSDFLTSLFQLPPADSCTNDRSPNSTSDIFYDRKHMGCANLSKETMFLREIHKSDIQKYFDGKEYFEIVASQEMKRLHHGLISNPGSDVNPHVGLRTFYKNICSILLTGTVLSDSDPDHNVLWDFVDSLFTLIEPSIDGPLKKLPFLKNFPGRCGDVYRQTMAARDKVAKRYFDDQKASYVPGRVRGLVDVCLERQYQVQSPASTSDVIFTDEYIKGLIFDTLAAGMTELLKTMRLFMLLMCHHQDVQTRLQAEIDAVIGSDRGPVATDRTWMPYCQAVMLEVWRYGSQTPLAIPHKTNRDVILEDYLIHKDSVIFPNLYGIHHDEGIWGDPWTFRPERFLDTKGFLLPSDHKLMKNVVPFSIGRRSCPGQDFARSRTFICMTSLLQRVRLLPPASEDLPSPDPRLYTKQYPLTEPQYKCHVVSRENIVI